MPNPPSLPNPQPSKPPTVNGIRETDWNALRTNPAFVALTKYLDDFAAALEREHLTRWKSAPVEDGFMSPIAEAAAREQWNTIIEIRDLRFEHMLAFYEGKPGADEQADDQAHDEGAQ